MSSRLSKTSFKPRLAGSLKLATDELVNAVGGQGKAAEYCRVSRTTIAKYTDPEEHTLYMPADVVRDLEARADYPYVTNYMANESGYGLRKIGDDSMPAQADFAMSLSHAVRECNDVSIAGIEALADGELSIGAARLLHKETGEAMKALMTVQAQSKAVFDKVRGAG